MNSPKKKTADELVVEGWKKDYSLVHMRYILSAEGHMVSPYAILKTWIELEENKNTT